MNGALAVFGGLGGLMWMVLATLAFLSPIFFYLTQRNTCQTRNELRRTNKLLEQMINIMGDTAVPAKENPSLINNQSSIVLKKKEAKQGHPSTPEKSTSNTVTMTCEHCGKSFRYGDSHSGKYMPCPGCQKSILLK